MTRLNFISISNFISFFRQLFSSAKVDEKGSKYKVLWQKLKIWGMLFFGLSLFGLLISQISLSDFLNNFFRVNLFYFFAAFLVGISVTILKTIRFGYFYPAPGRWLGLYGVFAVLRVVYYILPFNTGELVYLAALKKYQYTPTIAETAPTWLFLRLTDIIALALWFTFVLFIVPFTGNLFGEMYSFRWAIIGIASAMLVIILSLPFWVPRIPLSKNENWFTNRIKLFQSGFNRTFGMTTLVRTLINSLLIWFSAILFDTLALIAFNTPLSFMECFLATTAMYSISLLPLNAPLNIGTDEAIWTGILMLSGIAANQAISIALGIRIVSFLVLLTEGIIGFSFSVLRENYRPTLDQLQ